MKETNACSENQDYKKWLVISHGQRFNRLSSKLPRQSKWAISHHLKHLWAVLHKQMGQ